MKMATWLTWRLAAAGLPASAIAQPLETPDDAAAAAAAAVENPDPAPAPAATPATGSSSSPLGERLGGGKIGARAGKRHVGHERAGRAHSPKEHSHHHTAVRKVKSNENR